MLWWLVDNANVVYAILGLVFLVVLVMFWQNKRVRDIGAMLLIIALGVLIWYSFSFVMTDRKQVESTMRSLADAALFDKPDDVAPLLSKDFRYGGLTRKEVGPWVTQRAKSAGVSGYVISGFEVEKLTRDKETNQGSAQASFRLRVDHSNGSFPALCRAGFVLEDGQWRLLTFKLFNPAADSDKAVEIRLHE